MTTTVDEEPRCPYCRKMLAYKAARPWEIKCNRCKVVVTSLTAENVKV